MTQRTFVASLLSCLAILAAIVHAIFPQLTVDSTTAILLGIAILPWLGLFLRSFELPGGIKVEYQELMKVDAKARESGLISTTATASQPDPLWERIAAEDPNLALAALRIELEKALMRLADKHGVTATRRPATWVAHELSRAGVISSAASSALTDLIPILNKAVHGAQVESPVLDWMLTGGTQILSSLQAR